MPIPAFSLKCCTAEAISNELDIPREAIKMAESLGIWWSRCIETAGRSVGSFQEGYDKRAVFWPWADKAFNASFLYYSISSGLRASTVILLLSPWRSHYFFLSLFT